MQTNQFSIHNKLPLYGNYLLMAKLGVSKYLLKKSCQQNRTLEQSTVNGWIEGKIMHTFKKFSISVNRTPVFRLAYQI